MRSSKLFAVFLCLLGLFALPAAAQFPPSPAVKVAVNPVTNKVYIANGDENTVTAFNATTGTSTTIPVGQGASFIAVNPLTNRVFVNNGRESSLTVIDGATDTAVATYPIGSTGPISINPVTNVVYIVRLTGTGSDEITYFDDNSRTWYSIATESFQPNAMAVNPATDTLYIAHYASGDVRVISGTFNPNNDFPLTTKIGVWQRPIAIAINPVTNKTYVITNDSRGPISVINGANNSIVFPAVTAGRAVGAQAVAVNPVSNKAYAAFANEVVVINGSNNALKYIPISGAASGGIALAINPHTNRIYAVSASGVVSVIDGDTDTVVSTDSVSSGSAPSVGVNPVTGAAYFFNSALAVRSGSGTVRANPITTTITPLAGNTTTSSGSITLNAASSFAPTAMPVRAVYYRFDSTTGPWQLAAGSGPYSAPVAGLAPGSHTIHAFAVDPQAAPLSTGPGSMPLVGNLASYAFTVSAPAKQDASVSLSSSSNPATVGQPVTFTAAVSGVAGTATGSVDFLDGSTAIPGCAARALSSGTATCSTSALSMGSHSITARYGGDAAYNAATSSAISQAIGAKPSPTVTVASSSNPATQGRNVTFTASVSGSAGTATGSVDFLDGDTAIASCAGRALVSGGATCATSTLALGSHAITVRYSGDAAYAGGTSAVLTQTVTADSAGADLALSISATSTASTGKDADVTLVVTNSGPGAASNVVVTHTLPTGWSFAWAPRKVCTHSSGTVTCNVAILEGNATVLLRIVARPGSAGTAVSQASVTSAQYDPSGANNSASATTTVSTSPAAAQVTRYRLYSPVTREHHFTTDRNEYDTLGARGGWVQEGTAGKVLDNPGAFNGVTALPYYRLYNKETRWHHWTTDANEYYTLVQFPAWQGEGTDGYILPTMTTGATELYRLLYPDGTGLHHWTIDRAEYDSLIRDHGWVGEGGSGYVIR